ncbi:GyrI-like domain-containing protein [Colwelliaceae bacterium BS250]
MDVKIINFPKTKVAVIEHLGSPMLENESNNKLIEWRKENKLPPSDIHRSYRIYYNDPNVVLPADYRVDLCVSIEHEIAENTYGVLAKTIPARRCAKVRHLGSRENMTTARDLYKTWLPNSGEKLTDFPVFFHYVNVGPQIKESDMITDVYLPIL